jgi:hypothetical protein
VCLEETRGEGLGFGGSAAARASAYTVVRWLFQQRCCLHENSAEAAACAASATSRCTRPSMDALEADQRAVTGWGWGLGVHACVRACGRARALLRGKGVEGQAVEGQAVEGPAQSHAASARSRSGPSRSCRITQSHRTVPRDVARDRACAAVCKWRAAEESIDGAIGGSGRLTAWAATSDGM